MTAIRSTVFIPIAALFLVAPPEVAAQVKVEGNMVETKASSACALLVAPGSQKHIDCTYGTVYDTEAGIFWLKNADCIFGPSRRSWDNAMLVTGAISHGQDCDFDGSPDLTDGSQDGDWRLPTYREWLIRVFQPAMSGCLPALFNDPGTGCLADGPSAFANVVEDEAYWSSSTISFDPTKAYAASLSPADVSPVDKSSELVLWPVRDALPHELPFLAQVDGLPMETRADRCLPDAATYDQRYIDCGDGTVLDTVTDLLWLQDATCAQLPFLAGGEGDWEGRHFECLNGAVKDAVTGLVWLRVADCAELPGTGGSNVGDWFTAHAAAAALEDGICGLSDGSQPGDWRLPTQREWEATLAHARFNLGCIGVSGPTWTNSAGDACWTSLEPEYEGITAISYWAATSDPIFPSFAEVANLSSGTTTTQILKFSSAAIWPVRGKCISRDCD